MHTYGSINTYNSDCKKILRTKTKPGPYLHVAILEISGINKDGKIGPTVRTKTVVYWAIYAWDTREVLEVGEGRQRRIEAFTTGRIERKDGIRIPKAKDNLKHLKGNNQIIKIINRYVLDEMKYSTNTPMRSPKAPKLADLSKFLKL